MFEPSTVAAMLLVLLFGYLIYVFLIWNFDYWGARRVRGPKPRPLLGTFPSLLTRRQHFADDIKNIYRKYKDSENFVGVFLMRTPQLLILEPELVHQVFVTAFKHFQDNDVARLVDPKKDPLIANNPFILAGQQWREQRALVSPGLTSSRIKVAYALMQTVCSDWCDYIRQEQKLSPVEGLNAKELALRFTSEVVSDCVLGIKAKSFSSQPIPIGENVRMFSENNAIFVMYSLMAGLLPSIVNLYRVKFFPMKCELFFIKLMREAFLLRATNNVERQDFMNHLLTLKEKKQLSEMNVASHTMTFLIDGLDTSATVISHCLLLLAREPTKQQILYDEIMKHSNELGELSFEQLNELPYLDACLHESIRIFPPGLWSIKTCTLPYEFTNKNGEKLQVQVGDSVMLPIYALHHDPQYYPNPEQFQPERFLPEYGGDLKKYRDMGLFLGFGDGPRQCLGMRFALVQTKAAIAAIVRNFKVSVNPRTKPENKLDPKAFLAMQHGGVWLDFEQRN